MKWKKLFQSDRYINMQVRLKGGWNISKTATRLFEILTLGSPIDQKSPPVFAFFFQNSPSNSKTIPQVLLGLGETSNNFMKPQF